MAFEKHFETQSGIYFRNHNFHTMRFNTSEKSLLFVGSINPDVFIPYGKSEEKIINLVSMGKTQRTFLADMVLQLDAKDFFSPLLHKGYLAFGIDHSPYGIDFVTQKGCKLIDENNISSPAYVITNRIEAVYLSQESLPFHRK